MMYKFDKFDQKLINNTISEPNILQAIPFHIEKEGPAKVYEYFNCKVTEETNEIHPDKKYFKNSLYGRSLKGDDVQMPLNTLAIVYERNNGNTREINYKPIEAFDKIRYWKHDELPSNTDKFKNTIGFIQVLNDLHMD